PLGVKLTIRRQRSSRSLYRSERGKNRDVRQVLGRDGSELLRVTEEVDRAAERINRLVPSFLKVRYAGHQNLLAQEAVRFTYLLHLDLEQVVEVLRLALCLTQDGHDLQDIHVHPLRLDEVESRSRLTPEMFELQSLWFQERIDQVEDVEPYAAAVDLGED